jgi:hypothetical protein
MSNIRVIKHAIGYTIIVTGIAFLGYKFLEAFGVDIWQFLKVFFGVTGLLVGILGLFLLLLWLFE